ncbi:MAG: hypothetical protein OEY21_08875, partial [Nitrospira sp.]|nr:hypothetical protein [Nitrospira sp.]
MPFEDGLGLERARRDSGKVVAPGPDPVELLAEEVFKDPAGVTFDFRLDGIMSREDQQDVEDVFTVCEIAEAAPVEGVEFRPQVIRGRNGVHAQVIADMDPLGIAYRFTAPLVIEGQDLGVAG